MDGNGRMNMRNWGFYEPMNVLKGHLGLHLMPTAAEKPNLGGQHHPAVMATANGGAFYYRGCGVSDSPIPMDYMRDAWITHRDRYLNVLPGNHHPTFAALPETSGGHNVQIIHPPDSLKDESVEQIEETDAEMDLGDHLKKRLANKTQKSLKPKKVKRAPHAPRDESSHSVQRARAPKKSAEVIINGIDMDISGIRIPVCSCTGTPQQCYRWGSGGWQSACCTTGMSMYPLPMSTKRRGARIAGRKMSLGAFKKVLEKLASEGYNFSNPIDLRTHWAKHGTNKFVTIK